MGAGEKERAMRMPGMGDAGGVWRAARRGRGAGDGDRADRRALEDRARASEIMSIVPSSQERLRLWPFVLMARTVSMRCNLSCYLLDFFGDGVE